MSMPADAGSLRQRVVFDKRGSGSDGGGGVVTGWQEQFSCAAAYVHRNVGEAVMNDRLQGKHTQVIRVRATSLTRPVTTGWRVRDARKGTIFNILDATESQDRAWIDLLAQSGGASG
ncbi:MULTISPECIES: phage head closure protein [unclassified Mesorhizobium]|uniref:phage head closure protein n=1 Tax=unclassified Mesorhizobium TaxID=325217 RepID=UPI0015E35741|nr:MULTISPECIES: phage head closure protein [unclassified Mesorhizobium]